MVDNNFFRFRKNLNLEFSEKSIDILEQNETKVITILRY